MASFFSYTRPVYISLPLFAIKTMLAVKHCCYGACRNVSCQFGNPKYPEIEGVFFILFVQPRGRWYKKLAERVVTRPWKVASTQIQVEHISRNYNTSVKTFSCVQHRF